MVPNARFTELLSDIEPSPTTISQASSANTGVRDHLECHETFKDRWVTSFLSGSYARDTSIRPVRTGDNQERPDVDIIVVTNFTMTDHPDDVLEELSIAIEDDGKGYPVARINKRSVRIETRQADMDVVPVIETWNGYQIPDRETGRWLDTNPPYHTRWSAEQNTLFGGRFKKLVKLMKWWRRTNPTGKRPKGFVLEVLVSQHMPQNEMHLGEAFATLLEGIYNSYATLASLDMKPVIPDPAIPGNDILAKVTLAQWKDFLERVRVHANYARRAQEESDMDEATRLWRKVFGDRFKTTAAANVAKAANYSSFAAATSPRFE
jgi:predicted nucleotidyltransferase